MYSNHLSKFKSIIPSSAACKKFYSSYRQTARENEIQIGEEGRNIREWETEREMMKKEKRLIERKREKIKEWEICVCTQGKTNIHR